MRSKEKIAYLRGLIEGQSIAENASITKFHEALLDAFDTIAGEIEELEAVCDSMGDYIEELEDEISELSECCDDEHECCCGHHHFEDDDEEVEYATAICPNCGNDIIYRTDSYDDEDELICSHCGKPFKQ